MGPGPFFGADALIVVNSSEKGDCIYARRPRLRIAGVPQHVIQRGNNRHATIFADEDYRCYLDCPRQSARRHHCAIHAYVLMTNHVHLLVASGEPGSISLVMRDLGRRCVQYINLVYQRTGTLWEGRFKANLVNTASYFLRCCRYIESNPVRAQMIAHPGGYRWSSYRFHAEGVPDPLLSRERSVRSCFLPTRVAPAD